MTVPVKPGHEARTRVPPQLVCWTRVYQARLTAADLETTHRLYSKGLFIIIIIKMIMFHL